MLLAVHVLELLQANVFHVETASLSVILVPVNVMPKLTSIPRLMNVMHVLLLVIFVMDPLQTTVSLALQIKFYLAMEAVDVLAELILTKQPPSVFPATALVMSVQAVQLQTVSYAKITYNLAQDPVYVQAANI